MRSGADIDGIENSETITARVPLNCPSLVSVPCRRIPCTVADRFCDRAARVDWSLGHLCRRRWDIASHSDSRLAFLSSVLVRDLPKSAKDMLVVEFTDLEIGSATKRY
jgi:hypothetical protein